MKRIDIVYEKLKEIYKGEGLSASQIAKSLNITRANASSDLNKLWQDGLIKKDKEKKTALFFPMDKNNKGEKNEDVFENFLRKNKSLKVPIEQAKAAVLYPPNGMHVLILGETGVGKSVFANIISKYAIEIGKMEKGAPFIVFNCADYSNNPQLLISQLFGTKKGAYTGAESDKIGLIERANKGILFLDEVHRLPPEGQEMFFTFMDKGIFRRLGETESDRKADVLIVSATTEDTDSVLLKTFTRRIPMVINIPTLKERGIEERFNLITQFFNEEASRFDKNIKVSINSIKCLLGYDCPNNVGQLRTDIQLACAKAYLAFVSGKKEEILIKSMDLPDNIRQGLYLETEHRKLWHKLMDITVKYITFDSNNDEEILKEKSDEKNIYEMIENNISRLRSTGVTTEQLVEKMERDIENYFNVYVKNVNEKFDTSTLENIIDIKIINLVKDIIRFSEDSLGRRVNEKIYYGMAVHIDNSIKRIKNKKTIINTKLNEIRANYRREFNIALQCLEIIEKRLNILVPIDEAGFIAMFLAYNDEKEVKKSKVKVIVIAHGVATATSMVDTANKLLGGSEAIGINAPIDERPQDTIIKLKKLLINLNVKNDILFLVDMGSLTNLGEEIKKEMFIDSKTVELVSTLHVIEAARKASLGCSLDEIYKSTIAINSLKHKDIIEDNIREEDFYKENKTLEKKIAIVTICTTGEGGAVAIKKFLNEKLENKNVDIIPVGLYNSEDITKKIKEIEETNKVICIITSFHIDIDIPQFGLDEILSLKKIESIEELVEIENTYIKIGETLQIQLKHIDAKEVVEDIKKINERIQEKIHIRVSSSILIGVTMHVAYMIDKLKEGNFKYNINGEKIAYIKEKQQLYNVIKKEARSLCIKYNVKIDDNEVFYIMKSFDVKNKISK